MSAAAGRQLAVADPPGTTAGPSVESAVTFLFVPGDRPERFAKAAAAGADAVILDLEDAVDPANKDAARANVIGALTSSAHGALQALVRVNAPNSEWFAADLAALAALVSQPGHGLRAVVLPKTEYPAQVALVREALSGTTAVVPLVETALGVVNALDVARTRGVARLAFGAVDYTLDIGASQDPRALEYARGVLVVVSRAAGIAAPLDAPATAIKDLDRVAAEAELASVLGFGGKLCIHPGQLPAVRAAFVPDAGELDWARKVIGVADSGAAQVNGEMIDKPVLERARRIIVRATTLVQP